MRPTAYDPVSPASTSPSRTASNAACVRSCTPSFIRMLLTWVFTVFSDTTSVSASSRFDNPRPSRPSTSRSRGVSEATSPPGGGCATSSITRPAICGSRSASPSCTSRTAASSPDGSTSFSRYPAAPAWTAGITWSSDAKLVSTTTRVSGTLARRRRIAATPPPPGITRSMSTTSGRSRSTAVTAVSPSPASPTTSIPGRDSRNVRSPCRTTGWSSARNTRMAGGSATRDLHPHRRPRTGRGLDRERPAEGLRPLPHRRETETPLSDGACGRVEAHAVVPHRDGHHVVGGIDVDRDRFRPGVADGVVQRLLDDAVQLDLHRRSELGRAVHPEIRLQAVSAPEDLDVLADSCDEPVGLEAGRSQLEDQRAQLGLRLAGEPADVVDLGFGARGVGANEAGGGLGGQ